MSLNGFYDTNSYGPYDLLPRNVRAAYLCQPAPKTLAAASASSPALRKPTRYSMTSCNHTFLIIILPKPTVKITPTRKTSKFSQKPDPKTRNNLFRCRPHCARSQFTAKCPPSAKTPTELPSACPCLWVHVTISLQSLSELHAGWALTSQLAGFCSPTQIIPSLAW